MNKLIIGLFGLLVMLLISAMIFLYNDELNRSYVCVKRREFVMEKWQGVVFKKYLDSSNHNSETIRFTSEKSYAMFRDGTDFFKSIEIGDSLVKSSKTDSVKIYRNGSVHILKVDFGCPAIRHVPQGMSNSR